MFKVGEIGVRLGWLEDDRGFQAWERRLTRAQQHSKREIEARLGARLDPDAFDAYYRQLNRAEQRAKRRDAFRAALGGDFDAKAFNAYERQLGRTERENDKLGRSNKETGLSFGALARRAVAAGAAIGIAYKGAEAAHRAVDSTQALGKEVLTLSRSFGMSERAATAWAVQARVRGADGGKLTMAFKQLSTQVRTASIGIDQQSDALDTLRKKNDLRLRQAEADAATAKDQAGATRRLTELKQQMAAAEDELSHKTLSQARAFEQLGISQKELREHGNDLDWVIRRVSDGMGRLPEGTDRAALAARLFGRTWTVIFPLIRGGTDAMDEQLDVARRYGIDFGRGAEGVQRLLLAQRELRIAQLALQVQFTQQIQPTLIRVMQTWAQMAQVISSPNLSMDAKVAEINRRLQPLLRFLERTFNEWVPQLASIAAHAAPTIVEAFVGAFLTADTWGKVAIGAWLVTKFGGWGAIRGLGKRIGATIGLEVATGVAAGGAAGSVAGGAGGAAAGAASTTPLLRRLVGSRAGQVLTGGSLARLGLTRALPAFLAYDVAKQATTGSSPVRDWANTRGTYRGFELPTTGGGFRSTMRDLEHWSLQQPEWETKARKLGDTIEKLGGQLNRLSSAKLRRLGIDAREAARNFEPARQALGAFADDVGEELGRRFDAALERLARGPRFQTKGSFVRAIEAQWRSLPLAARGAGAASAIELAASMEREGRLPKGATNKIIRDLEQRWSGLRPYLRRTGMESMAELSHTLEDRRAVRAVQKQVDTIAHTWADAPKLARTNATNARANWQKEMDFLVKKIRTSTGEQRRIAVEQWTQLQRSGARAATATDRAFGLMLRGVSDSFGSLAGVVGGSLGGIVSTTNQALRAFGIAPIRFSLSGLARFAGSALGFVGALTRAGGGWIGAPGERGHDTVPVLAGAGEAFLNHQQQGPVDVALAVSQAIGAQPFGSLEELFAATAHTRHFFAGGGRVAGGPRFDGHPSNVSAPLRALMSLVERQWPQLVVTSTTDHSTNTSSGGRSLHVDGAAVDFAAEPGYMYRVSEWIKSSGLYRRLAEGIHNPNLAVKYGQLVDGPSYFASGGVWGQHISHIHLAILGALGALAGLGRISKVLVGGPAGALRDLAQAASDKVRGGANAYLARRSNAGLDTSGPAPLASGSYGKSALGALWRSARGAAAASRIASAIGLAESHGDPNAVNYNTDGSVDRGLWQINSVHGALSTFDPLGNARAAVAISGNGRNWNPWVTFRTGAYRRFFSRGGRLARFAGGGIVGRALRGRGTRARGMRNIGRSERDIDALNRTFSFLQRRFDLSEEDWIIEGDEETPPSIDEAALAKHTREQLSLLDVKEMIHLRLRQLVRLVNRTMALYRAVKQRVNEAIGFVTDRLSQLRGRRGRQAARSREHLQSQLEKLRDALPPIESSLGELDVLACVLPWDVKDVGLDVMELRQEIKALNPRAQLREAQDGWSPPPGPGDDPPPEDPPEDPGAGDQPPAPPSPAEIAQAAAEQLAEFGRQQTELFSSFGSNFVARGGSLLGPGGAVSPSAALRGFGAFGQAGGGPIAAAGGGVHFEQHITMMAPPADPHVWAHQQRFEVEAALG